MIDIALAIAPIFLLICLGTLLRATGAFGDPFWRAVEKLTFNGLFPSLLFVKISSADVDWTTGLPTAAAIIGGILLTALSALPFRGWLGLDPARFVAMFQGGFRSNAYVGIAVVIGVLGDAAAGPLAISMLTVGITINFLGVVGHLVWLPNQNTGTRWAGIARDTLKNPLIFACILGGTFNAVGWGLPPVIGPTLVLFSQAALPMGLMAVGAGLTFSAALHQPGAVTVSCVSKLVLQPLLTFFLAVSLGLSGFALAVPVIFAALPTSSTAYVVSRRMGSDPELMAVIVTTSHLAAIVSLPVLLAIL